MRKLHTGAVLLAAAGLVMSTYGCSDESDATTLVDPETDAGDSKDAGKRPSTGDDEDEPPASTDSGAKDAGSNPDASDAGDAGDAADADSGIDAGPPKVVVLRAGDGTTLGEQAVAAFLDEYELGTNTLTRTIALPTAKDADNHPLVLSAPFVGGPEGSISRSPDEHAIAVSGYTSYYTETAIPPFVVMGPDISSRPRVVARVAADGALTTTTLLSDSLHATYITGAAISGSDVWISGTPTGTAGPVQHLTLGNSLNGGATTGGNIISPAEPHLALRIFEGQLYASTVGGMIKQLGMGLPTTSGQSVTTVINGADGLFEFELVDLDGQPGAERLYVAVDGSRSADGVSGGVQRYVYDAQATTWTLDATFTDGVTTGVRGLTAYKDGSNVVIVTTTTEGDRLLRFVDTGAGTPTSAMIATAPNGAAFRGVALAPRP